MLQTPEEFRNILLKTTEDGAKVYLRDVAEVAVGQQTYMVFATYDD